MEPEDYIPTFILLHSTLRHAVRGESYVSHTLQSINKNVSVQPLIGCMSGKLGGHEWYCALPCI